MKNLTKVRVGLVAASLVSLGAAGIAPSFADYAPSSTDVVGVGGDTPQYDLNFLADGDANGDLGFNSANNPNKLVTFSATADANGRTAYLLGATNANSAASLLNPTVVYRAGTKPVKRVSSSGEAITALLADNGAVRKIDFIFSGSLPTAQQQQTAGDSQHNWGFLHVVQLGTDTVSIAAASNTNAPAGLSINDLLKIYTGVWTTWGQVTGYSGPAPTATIVPLLPPSTSAIYKQLVADLKTANGGTAPTLSGIQTVQQNDPTAVSSNPNAIVPFSAARLNLFNSGYFQDPTVAFPGSGTPLSAGAKLLTGGVDGTATAGYAAQIFHYVIFRNSDLSSTTPFEPGGTQNFVQALFSNSTGTAYVASGPGQALLTAAGITPNYQDLGPASLN